MVLVPLSYACGSESSASAFDALLVYSACAMACLITTAASLVTARSFGMITSDDWTIASIPKKPIGTMPSLRLKLASVIAA